MASPHNSSTLSESIERFIERVRKEYRGYRERRQADRSGAHHRPHPSPPARAPYARPLAVARDPEEGASEGLIAGPDIGDISVWLTGLGIDYDFDDATVEDVDIKLSEDKKTMYVALTTKRIEPQDITIDINLEGPKSERPE